MDKDRHEAYRHATTKCSLSYVPPGTAHYKSGSDCVAQCYPPVAPCTASSGLSWWLQGHCYPSRHPEILSVGSLSKPRPSHAQGHRNRSWGRRPLRPRWIRPRRSSSALWASCVQESAVRWDVHSKRYLDTPCTWTMTPTSTTTTCYLASLVTATMNLRTP